MKVVAAWLCLALAASWVYPAHAQEVRPDFGDLEPGATPDETYRLNALGIVRESMSGAFPTIFVGRSEWWRPVRGKFRYATSYNEFFLKTGRDDLGAQHRNRRAVAATLFWGGTLVSVGGLVVMLTGLSGNHDTRAWAGLGMLGGGVVVSSIGSSIQPPLISDEEAEAMANEYNRRLQVHLGLAAGAPSAGGAAGDRRLLGLSLSHRW